MRSRDRQSRFFEEALAQKRAEVAKAKADDPTNPSLALLVKIGSAVVHADEMLSSGGHEFDRAALKTVLDDTEVKAWIEAMTKMALLPVKR